MFNAPEHSGQGSKGSNGAVVIGAMSARTTPKVQKNERLILFLAQNPRRDGRCMSRSLLGLILLATTLLFSGAAIKSANAADRGRGRVGGAIEEIEKASKRDGNPEESIDAARTRSRRWVRQLKNQGPSIVPEIETAIRAKPNEWMRNVLLTDAIGDIEDRSAAETLFRLLSDAGQHIHVRTASARNLAELKLPAGEEFIKRAVEDRSLPLRARQIIMMELPERQFDDVAWLRKIATADASVFGEGQEITQEEFGMILNAQRTLATSKNPQATDALLDLVDKHPSNSILIKSLAKRGDRRAIPVLIKCLKTESSGSASQGSAALALGEFKATEAVPALIKIVEKHQNTSLVSVAARALGEIGDRSAIPALEKMVSSIDEDPRFNHIDRQQAKEGWGYIPPIIEALEKLKR